MLGYEKAVVNRYMKMVHGYKLFIKGRNVGPPKSVLTAHV